MTLEATVLKLMEPDNRVFVVVNQLIENFLLLIVEIKIIINAFTNEFKRSIVFSFFSEFLLLKVEFLVMSSKKLELL